MSIQLNTQVKYDNSTQFQAAVDEMCTALQNKNTMADASVSGILQIREMNLWDRFLSFIRIKPTGHRLETIYNVLQTFLSINEEHLAKLDLFTQNKLLGLRVFQRMGLPDSLNQLNIKAIEKLTQKIRENQELLENQKNQMQAAQERLVQAQKRVQEVIANAEKEATDKVQNAQNTISRIQAPTSLLNPAIEGVLKTLRSSPGGMANLELVSRDGISIFAIKSFLQSVDFFASETLEKMRENEKGKIKINLSQVADSATINLFLDYHYVLLSQKMVSSEQLFQLYDLAHYFMDEKLKKEILETLISRLNADTREAILPDLLALIINDEKWIGFEKYMQFRRELSLSEINLQEACREFVKKMATDGNAFAQFLLGDFYATGFCGQEQNQHLGNDWYTLSASQNFSVACNNLAYNYECGRGVEQDFSVACTLYQKAADLNCEIACSNIAGCYAHGRGVPHDIEKARYWYIKAIELGHKKAEADLNQL